MILIFILGLLAGYKLPPREVEVTVNTEKDRKKNKRDNKQDTRMTTIELNVNKLNNGEEIN